MSVANPENFNKEQLDALTTIEGPALVLAGAGSGKTRVVTSRITYLIEQGIPPSQILAVTFTNKAAAEMRERVQKLTKHLVVICTFHSLGARILRESIEALGYPKDFAIYDEDDVEKLLKICLEELRIQDKKLDIKPFRKYISQAKNELREPEQISNINSTELEDLLPQVYFLYQKKLKEYHAVDFDDLLFLPVKIWKEHPHILHHYQQRWSFLLIDEFQDTNGAQYTIAQLLSQKHNNLFVVGDPDQSIYSWRGANVNNILHFERDYPGTKVVRLEQNYRSQTNILNVANALISHNDQRYEKELWSNLGEGEKIKLFTSEDDKREAHFVASQIAYHQDDNRRLNEMVVFYRTNAQSRIFEDVLLSRRIPYVIVGGVSFYQRREIKDILSFLRLSHSGSDFISFARTINLPKRGLGGATLEKLRVNASQEGMTILRYCQTLINDEQLTHSIRLNAKQKEGLAQYLQIIHSLHEAAKTEPINFLVKLAIEQTGYLSYLEEDRETYTDRCENLNELLAKATEWELSSPNPSLTAFLEELSLKSTLDETDDSQDRLSLMTIHNGKGLEFEVVFLVGLEEDLFPHINSRSREDAIEEERRLCYVGVTRAKRYLYLSHCNSRFIWGGFRSQRPSRFLLEMPKKYLERISSPRRINSSDGAFKTEIVRDIPKLHVQQEGEFATGDRIFHKDFGIGQVQEAYQGSMGLTYKILFDRDRSLKTLVAKYATLNPI